MFLFSREALNIVLFILDFKLLEKDIMKNNKQMKRKKALFSGKDGQTEYKNYL